tara:strand:- start:1555 stop:1791 length:237 start_codon:yes stop_codon:yes gene_type:complete
VQFIKNEYIRQIIPITTTRHINMVEQIEEVLMEAHSYGIRQEVIEAGRIIRHDNPNLTQLESIERAFKQLLGKWTPLS